MLDRDQLETFAMVVEQRSFDRAANVLSITRGAVSQRIKALEESLATILVVRERPISLTHAGEVLMRHVKALRIMEGSALQELTPKPSRHAPVPPVDRCECRFAGHLVPRGPARTVAESAGRARSHRRRPGPYGSPARPGRGHRMQPRPTGPGRSARAAWWCRCEGRPTTPWRWPAPRPTACVACTWPATRSSRPA